MDFSHLNGSFVRSLDGRAELQPYGTLGSSPFCKRVSRWISGFRSPFQKKAGLFARENVDQNHRPNEIWARPEHRASRILRWEESSQKTGQVVHLVTIVGKECLQFHTNRMPTRPPLKGLLTSCLANLGKIVYNLLIFSSKISLFFFRWWTENHQTVPANAPPKRSECTLIELTEQVNQTR